MIEPRFEADRFPLDTLAENPPLNQGVTLPPLFRGNMPLDEPASPMSNLVPEQLLSLFVGR